MPPTHEKKGCRFPKALQWFYGKNQDTSDVGSLPAPKRDPPRRACTFAITFTPQSTKVMIHGRGHLQHPRTLRRAAPKIFRLAGMRASFSWELLARSRGGGAEGKKIWGEACDPKSGLAIRKGALPGNVAPVRARLGRGTREGPSRSRNAVDAITGFPR